MWKTHSSLHAIWTTITRSNVSTQIGSLRSSQSLNKGPCRKNYIKAVGYVRRSNVDEDSGSFDRQEKAIKEFAKRSGHMIIEDGFFYDGGTSGTTSLMNAVALALPNAAKLMILRWPSQESRLARHRFAKCSSLIDSKPLALICWIALA